MSWSVKRGWQRCGRFEVAGRKNLPVDGRNTHRRGSRQVVRVDQSFDKAEKQRCRLLFGRS